MSVRAPVTAIGKLMANSAMKSEIRLVFQLLARAAVMIRLLNNAASINKVVTDFP